ncbi:HXXEE domain-containing protein [Actinoplanes hulinensis]|uniref:HXXEE domain-containing protein n=1 Tax=Actinoplanes hulinensis TaxID=1144547 RepID=A0ABS7B4L4_9ACTN|nr:HXXEE domain-containing protein [Actinoplanes hulinensis]MBW6435905.1 HXXEE domain-containing protein [Actinoplanes hulinensis]
MTKRPELFSATVMAVLGVAFCSWALLTLPLQGAAVLVLATLLGWSGWIAFSYTRPVRSRRVIAVYLCAVGFQLIHMAEEYTGGFPHEIVELFDSPRDWPENEFLLVFVFGFGALYFFAGAGALYRIRVANFFLWWYALGAGLLNGIAHFVFPIIAGGYFPGLYTATGHLLMSGLLIYLLVKESRDLKAADQREPALAAASG